MFAFSEKWIEERAFCDQYDIDKYTAHYNERLKLRCGKMRGNLPARGAAAARGGHRAGAGQPLSGAGSGTRPCKPTSTILVARAACCRCPSGRRRKIGERITMLGRDGERACASDALFVAPIRLLLARAASRVEGPVAGGAPIDALLAAAAAFAAEAAAPTPGGGATSTRSKRSSGLGSAS